MGMLRHAEFEEARIKKTLDMLLMDRKNEFRELAEAIFSSVPNSKTQIPNWEKFVMDFCLDVTECFETWAARDELLPNSGLKALTILRQLSKDKKSMIEMTRLLNVAWDLSNEFKLIYKRIE